MKAEINQPPHRAKGKALETATATKNAEDAITAPPTIVRVPYICGAITGTAPFQREEAFQMCCKLSDACAEAFGHRGWIPHKHLAGLNEREASAMVRTQICNHTSIMVVLGLNHSWGGGIAIEIAFGCGVPVILFASNVGPQVSPQLLGHPGIKGVVRDDYLHFLSLPENTSRILRQIVRDNSIVLKDDEQPRA